MCIQKHGPKQSHHKYYARVAKFYLELYLLNVSPCLQTSQENNRLLGFSQFLHFIRHYQWDLGHLIDNMTLAEHQSGDTAGSNSRSQGVSTKRTVIMKCG